MAILYFFIALVMAAPAAAMDANELLKQVDRNLTPVSYEAYRKLINIEPSGRKKEFVLYTVKKGKDKVINVLFSKHMK